jgi:hypothetical protein
MRRSQLPGTLPAAFALRQCDKPFSECIMQAFCSSRSPPRRTPISCIVRSLRVLHQLPCKGPSAEEASGSPSAEEASGSKVSREARGNGKKEGSSTHHLAHPPCCMPSTQTYPLRAWDRSPPALGTVPRPWAQCHTYPWERSPPPLGTAPCLFTGFLAAGKKVKMLEQPTMSKAAIERMKEKSKKPASWFQKWPKGCPKCRNIPGCTPSCHKERGDA